MLVNTIAASKNKSTRKSMSNSAIRGSFTGNHNSTTPSAEIANSNPTIPLMALAKTLRKQLPDHARLINAEGDGHGHFLSYPEGSRKQKIGDIRTGYQQHTSNYSSQYQQRHSCVADHSFAIWRDQDAHFGLGNACRLFLVQPLKHCREIPVCCFNACSRT
jgi:hypothetical protein